MCDQPDTTSIISSDARTYSTSDEPMSTVLSDFKTTTNVQDYKTSDEVMSTALSNFISTTDIQDYSTSDEPVSTVLSDFITTTNVRDYKTSDEAMSTALSDFISTTHIQDDKTADESSTMADEKYSLGRVNTTLTTSQGVSSRTHNRSDEPTTNTHKATTKILTTTLLSSSNDITTRNVDDTDTSTISGALDSFTTVSDDVSVTPDSSTSFTKCSCPCLHTTNPWEYLSTLNLTKEQLLVHLNGHLTKLKNEISVNSKNTSSYKATKLSAGDTRGSSKMMGFIGIVVICLMLFFMISADIMKLLIYCLSC